jgi:excisionase family DNA binding protein
VSATTAILDKLRRAYRNNAGTHFSNDELKHLAKLGILHLLAKAEADEIVASLEPTKPNEPPQIDRPVHSVRTLAERWQCSEGLIRSMIARGELQSFRHGNLIRITAEAVASVESKRD